MSHDTIDIDSYGMLMTPDSLAATALMAICAAFFFSGGQTVVAVFILFHVIFLLMDEEHAIYSQKHLVPTD